MYNMKVLTNMDVMELEDTKLPGTPILQHRGKHRCKDNLLEDLKPKIWLLQEKEKII